MGKFRKRQDAVVDARGPLTETEMVTTAHGRVRAEAGDYILTNLANGDTWPIKPDLFNATYESADEVMEDEFKKELESLINKHSMENGSDTPDFILASFLSSCLKAFDRAVVRRTKWYGKNASADSEDKEECSKKANDNRSPEEKKRDICCTLAGPGRGDCEHFVGFPKKLEYPETVDEYGRPHDWCFYCWNSYQLSEARRKIAQLGANIAKTPPRSESK